MMKRLLKYLVGNNLLNVPKYSNSSTQHRRTPNLNASVYIMSINWYIRSNYEMWQHIVTTEWVGARYRCNVQQYLLILIYTYGTDSLNDAKMREEVKHQIAGEEHWDTVSFYVASMSWSIFGRLIKSLKGQHFIIFLA